MHRIVLHLHPMVLIRGLHVAARVTANFTVGHRHLSIGWGINTSILTDLDSLKTFIYHGNCHHARDFFIGILGLEIGYSNYSGV